MNRRALLAAALALAATSAGAQTAAAEKHVEAGRVFPYLINYLKLPAADRSRWTMSYSFTRNGAPAAGLKGWILDGTSRVPIAMDADGRPDRLPTLAQLETKRMVDFDVPPDSKMGTTVSMELSLRPSAEVPAAELAAGVAQAAAGARKAAPLAVRMLVPKFDRVTFPGGEGGEVVLADGRTAALPRAGKTLYFKPADHPTARTVRFKVPPRRLGLGAP